MLSQSKAERKVFQDSWKKNMYKEPLILEYLEKKVLMNLREITTSRDNRSAYQERFNEKFELKKLLIGSPLH